MTKIYVKTPFELQHGEQKLQFGVGNHVVDQDVADHWYVKLHTGDESQEGKFDNDAAADELLSELEVKLRELQEQVAEVSAREDAVKSKEEALAAREDAVKSKEEAASKSSSKSTK